jgi:hypothetical protein
MSDEKISALLSDDRYDSKDWRHADLAGRIEWLIFMLKAKGEEVENMVRLAEPMLSDALAAAEKHIEELEAKLAKAVKALDAIARNFEEPCSGLTDFGERQHYLWLSCRLRDTARTTIAELKGEQL